MRPDRVPTVGRVTSSTCSPAAWLRPAVGAGALLLALGVASSATATATATVTDTVTAATTTHEAVGQVAPEADLLAVADIPAAGGAPEVDQSEALMLTWRKAPVAVQSSCTAQGSDEASSVRLAEVMGAYYRVDDREVTSGTVDVTDGDRVTVVARTRPGVRFEDDSTEATYVLEFSLCPAPAPSATQPPATHAPATQPPATQPPATQPPAPAAPTPTAPSGGGAPTSGVPVAAVVAAVGGDHGLGAAVSDEGVHPVPTSAEGPASSGTSVTVPGHEPTAVRARAVVTAPQTSAAAAGRLADTGTEAWQAAVLGGAMLLGGAGLLVAGRRC